MLRDVVGPVKMSVLDPCMMPSSCRPGSCALCSVNLIVCHVRLVSLRPGWPADLRILCPKLSLHYRINFSGMLVPGSGVRITADSSSDVEVRESLQRDI